MPVANPEGIAPLLAIAFAASAPDEPPPRVIALVQRPEGGDRPPGQEPEWTAPPPTPALLASIEYARAHGVAIDASAIWSGNPALDIIEAAQAAQVAWVLLGYHRTPAGSDTMGGVVREVLARAKPLPLNVGVFIQGTDRPAERVFAAVDAGPDGRAALALAVRIAQKNKARLRALLVSSSVEPKNVEHHEDDLVDMVQAARASIGRLLHTDVLTERSLHQLFKQTPGRLLIVGRKFAEEVGLPLDAVPSGDRCVIVVHGAAAKDPQAAAPGTG